MERKNTQQPYTSANEKTPNSGEGTGGRESGGRVEDSGAAGGNIVGGKPVEVTLIKVERLLRRGREVQIGSW